MNSSPPSARCPHLEVLFTPAEFEALARRDLSRSVCVVFDVLRATSSMITALDHGALGIIPVAEISEALALRRLHADILLAGERDGVRIRRDLTGSIDFDLGNSPREFTRAAVAGRLIAMTTTNGTRALRASAGASRVLVGGFVNLRSLARELVARTPDELLIICSGTHDEASYEDTLAAGALCDEIFDAFKNGRIADSAVMARELFRAARGDLAAAVAQARNGRRLLSMPDLRDDVAICLQTGPINLLAELRDGCVVKI
jgi:2-phosphosulfolactate phosphatase